MAGVWKRTMVYLGLMEDEEDLEEPQMMHDEAPRREEPTQMVRTIRRDDSHPAGRAVVRQMPSQQSPRQVHVVEPRIFDDAQEFADRFKGGVPVIINLRQTESRHAPKILHFASGLVYGLNGRMQRVAESVYLITPFNIEVSADEKRALAERGFFGEM
jgi:cell division inhibitor SepF